MKRILILFVGLVCAFGFGGFGMAALLFFRPPVPENPFHKELTTHPSVSQHLIVDQFGYRVRSKKVAVISNPEWGYNSQDAYHVGSNLEVREWDTHAVAYSAAPVSWHEGGIDHISGDKGWHFDFSELTKPGSYYIYDTDNDRRSYQFDIAPDVYAEVLRAACRMFFYNRSNVAKQPPFADPRWADAACHVGEGQDTEARAIWAKHKDNLRRDVTGAWYDAGDPNKYVSFLREPMHSLLGTLREYPKFWSEFSLNIPESSNQLPDLLDEVLVGMSWLERMQDSDGGVFIKVGHTDFDDVSPPSADRRPRFYGPKATSSTIIAAGIYAHAAWTMREFSVMPERQKILTERAKQAWQWYKKNLHNRDEHADTQEIKSGDADRKWDEQDGDAVVAAIYLYALTEGAEYGEWIVRHYETMQPWKDTRWGMWENNHGTAIMDYCLLPHADEGLKQRVLKKREHQAHWVDIYKYNIDENLYMAFNPVFTWGSNRTLCDLGQTVHELIKFGIAKERHGDFRRRAESIVHHMHGVNPLNLVYLTNMYEYGAENSANKLFHTWFESGTQWSDARTGPGPAPGYLVGGPNPEPNAKILIPGSRQYVHDQPPQKAYADDNHGHGIWAITEPAIYYQAAYIELLTHFVAGEDEFP